MGFSPCRADLGAPHLRALRRCGIPRAARRYSLSLGFVSGHEFTRAEKPQKRSGLQPLRAKRDSRKRIHGRSPGLQAGEQCDPPKGPSGPAPRAVRGDSAAGCPTSARRSQMWDSTCRPPSPGVTRQTLPLSLGFVSGHEFTRAEKPQKRSGLQPLRASESTADALAFRPGKTPTVSRWQPPAARHGGVNLCLPCCSQNGSMLS
jgi:hypothetical protein